MNGNKKPDTKDRTVTTRDEYCEVEGVVTPHVITESGDWEYHKCQAPGCPGQKQYRVR